MSDPLPARPCADIDPAPICWLWKPYLARGKLGVLDGDPGTGKSFVTVDLAARLSRGGPLPDGQPLARPNVTLLLNAEDDWADTVRPRAAAAGADLARVFVAGSPFCADPLPTFPDCMDGVRRLVVTHHVDLLVIDPMMAFFPPRACANSDQRIRQALAPLAGLAASTGCAVLLVRHLSKSAGTNAVYRGSGSIGILGSARTGLLLARHPDDPDLRVLAMTKTNLGPPAASLGFRLTAGAGEGGAALRWTGPVDLTADELCGAQAATASRRPRERAAAFLTAALAGGPRPVAELEALAAARGLCWKTVERARHTLGVITQQVRTQDAHGWLWRLPSLDADGDVLRSTSIRALLQLPKRIRALHELQREGDRMDASRPPRPVPGGRRPTGMRQAVTSRSDCLSFCPPVRLSPVPGNS